MIETAEVLHVYRIRALRNKPDTDKVLTQKQSIWQLIFISGAGDQT